MCERETKTEYAYMHCVHTWMHDCMVVKYLIIRGGLRGAVCFYIKLFNIDFILFFTSLSLKSWLTESREEQNIEAQWNVYGKKNMKVKDSVQNSFTHF